MSEQHVDGRLARGAATRRAVLRRAADIASVEGLSGLSIGRLATELDISKSGVFAHFGSKEELQLATVDTAIDIFRTEVLEPGLVAPPGIGRLWGLCTAWLRYAEHRVFPGGCFFFTVSAEFDSRPGRVRDAIAEARRLLRELLLHTADEAQRLDEITADTDLEQLIFELAAFGTGANSTAQLPDDANAYHRARTAILTRLRLAATDPTRLPATADAA